MSFVDFMIIGAMKSGTTTLADMLSQHPDICFSRKKEPHFFSKTGNWQLNIDDYKALYTPTEGQLCGEASTSYACYPEFNKTTYKSLYEFNPELKIIYIMRHPIDRMVSHYMHTYLRGYINSSFEEAVMHHTSYVNRTRYFTQIKPYLECFGPERVFLLTFEEFLSDKQSVLQRMASFLEIDYSRMGDFKDVHSNKSIGSAKKSIKIDQLRSAQWTKQVRSLLPTTLKKNLYGLLHRLTVRTLDEKPSVSADLNKALWDLVMLDVLEIEKLMQRELTEWSIPKDSPTH